MDIYNDYVSRIKAAMTSGETRKHELNLEGIANYNDEINKAFSYNTFRKITPEEKLLPSMQEFASSLNVNANLNQKLGEHPDFVHLKQTKGIEKHYIVSVFIDIKRSTYLFKKYPPETVLIITNTIQRAAIHTCLVFGGYIQRLHGDGLFVYFGRKGMRQDDAVKSALSAASTFTYFVKNDLKNLFNEQGIEAIFTRTGIDFGYDEDVVWALAGIGDISEITTYSLHTSLASKMQAYAESNGIVAGDHIKNHSDQRYFSPVCSRTLKEEDRYIFRIPDRNFNYTQYDFQWMNFLKSLEFIATDLNGILRVKNLSSLSKPSITSNLQPVAVQNRPYNRGS